MFETFPNTSERTSQELDLLMTLGLALMTNKGFTASQVREIYTRAWELCRQLEDSPQLFPTLFGLRVFYCVQGALRTGHELAEQLLVLAQRARDPALLLEAHLVMGAIQHKVGEAASARTHFEQSIALYNPEEHRSHAFLYGQDPGVISRLEAALALHLLGYPEQAQQRTQEGLMMARELAHPFTLCMALMMAQVHQFRREAQFAQTYAETVITLSTEQGFANWLMLGSIMRGWAMAAQGQYEEGIGQMHHGLASIQAAGAEMMRPYYLALLAEGYANVGRAKGGLDVLAEALSTGERTVDHLWEAEIYRLQGELLLLRSAERQLDAAACFQHALEVVCCRQEKLLELRASVSLGRLWQRQGKRAEARQLLTEIYDWFTEGFDTVDLQEAKALLQELS